MGKPVSPAVLHHDGLGSYLKPMTTNELASKNDSGTDHRTTVPVAGGALIYESRTLGRELVGFRDVTDWDDLADALRARGHGTGAIHHLPELDK